MKLFAKAKRVISTLLPQHSTSRITVLVLVGDAILFSSTILAPMILARIIPVDSMATYRQVIYLAPLAQIIVEFGLASSIYRFWNLLDVRRRSTFLKMQIMLSIGLGLLGSLGLALLAPFIASSYHNPGLLPAIYICCLYPLFNILPQSIRPIQICRGQPMLATGLQLIISILNVLELVVPILLGYSLLTALAVWNFTSIANLVIVPLVFKPSILPGSPWWDKQLFKEIWEYLWPLQAGRIPGIFTLYTDKIATSVYMSKQAFAAYSLGAREIPFVGKIGASVSSVLIPRMIEDVTAGNTNLALVRWRRACERTAIISYPVVGFCVCFALPIVNFLFSSTYAESAIPFGVYALITYIRVIEYGSLAKVFGQTRTIMWASLISAAVMIVLSFPLTALFGIWGISTAVLISVFASAAYFLLFYIKRLNVNLSQLFPWKELLTHASVSLISAGFIRVVIFPMFSTFSSKSMLTSLIFLSIYFILDLILYFAFMFLVKNSIVMEYRNMVMKMIAKSKQSGLKQSG
jgi:O-antigen/teichoic acid export membrane protein